MLLTDQACGKPQHGFRVRAIAMQGKHYQWFTSDMVGRLEQITALQGGWGRYVVGGDIQLMRNLHNSPRRTCR